MGGHQRGARRDQLLRGEGALQPAGIRGAGAENARDQSEVRRAPSQGGGGNRAETRGIVRDFQEGR